jgi:L-alanine-DL-glutamate epimerase-like enolase superfamily enzyme
VPLKYAAKWSGGTRETAPAILVEIETDEGLVGLGEGVGPTIPTIHAALREEFRPMLLGVDPMRTEWIVHRLEELSTNWAALGAYGIAAIEMALLDLKGKALNTSVANLLGGVYRGEIDYMGYLFIDEPDTNAEAAAGYARDGFRTLKVKVGRDIDFDTRRLKAIREAVGWEMRIRVDANMNWSPTTAIRAIRAMEPYHLEYVEQPVPRDDVEGMAQVARAVDVPLAADEGCTSLHDAYNLIRHKACEVFVIYVSESGGLMKAREIVGLANSEGIACVLGTWAELGIGTIAGAHLIASSRNFTMASDTHYPLQNGDIITPQLAFHQGRLTLPDGPGLGVTLDREAVDRFARQEARDQVFYDSDNPDFIPRIGQILR